MKSDIIGLGKLGQVPGSLKNSPHMSLLFIFVNGLDNMSSIPICFSKNK
jgi:hypothetical protein